MSDEIKFHDGTGYIPYDGPMGFTMPKVIGRLIIQNNLMNIEYTEETKHPNAWRRFWYWVLLGWKWERL